MRDFPDFWRLATTDERHELDFGSIFGGKQPGVAYRVRNARVRTLGNDCA